MSAIAARRLPTSTARSSMRVMLAGAGMSHVSFCAGGYDASQVSISLRVCPSLPLQVRRGPPRRPP